MRVVSASVGFVGFVVLVSGVGCAARATTMAADLPRDLSPPPGTHNLATPDELASVETGGKPRLREVVTLGHAEAEPIYAEPTLAPGANGTNVNVTIINQVPAYGYGSAYGYGGYGYGRYGSSGRYANEQPTYRSGSSTGGTHAYSAPANGSSTYVPRGGYVGSVESPVYSGGSSFNRGTTSAPTQVGGNWPAVHDSGPRPLH